MEIITFSGGDGTDIANAVVVEGAKSLSNGLDAEFDYMFAKHKLKDEHIFSVNMEFINKGSRNYVKFDIITKEEILKPVFFDISNCYPNVDQVSAAFIKEYHSHLIN